MNSDQESLQFSQLCDIEIVDRMRKWNYDKFKALVRMHLSFELDLNTDEFDMPYHEIIYEEKGKIKKWNRISKKSKYRPSTCVFSSYKTSSGLDADIIVNESLQQKIDPDFLCHLHEIKEFLMLDRNVLQEGIFRKTGSVSRQNELRLKIHKYKCLNLETGDYSAHDCATVFKGFLAELSEPLLTDAHYPAHMQLARLCLNSVNSEKNQYYYPENTHILNSLQLLLLLLPENNRQLLQHVIDLLHAVALQQHINKMSADNLATLFAPHLVCPRNLPPEVLHYVCRQMSSLVSYMISRGQEIFAIPTKLVTDIRAYFMERKRKKTMSPEITLDDSISDLSTVNTVYTFVDREKTAAARNKNSTDTELAQLYAHIQSLPESSKKRRLIKQFNKQNGQGTPLQLQVGPYLKITEFPKYSRTLSDSIKKHIFLKGNVSRTPKRQITPIELFETPNITGEGKHKQRILFPSINITSSFPTGILSPSLSSSSHIGTHAPQKISTALMKNPQSDCGNNSENMDDYQLSTISSKSNLLSISNLTKIVEPSKIESVPALIRPQISNEFPKCSNSAMKLHKGVTLESFKCSLNKSISIIGEHKAIQYKSEPNLSNCNIHSSTTAVTSTQEITTSKSKFISNKKKIISHKLMRAISTGDLKFTFATSGVTKHLVNTTNSVIRPSCSISHNYQHNINQQKDTKIKNISFMDYIISHDLDDDTFEDDPADDCGDSDSYCTINERTNAEMTITSNDRNIVNNVEKIFKCEQRPDAYITSLTTSVPSFYFTRRSISPITKSTQGMPKAMQESIMTPRSRKPVMLTTISNSTNQTRILEKPSCCDDQNEIKSVTRNLGNKNLKTKQQIIQQVDGSFQSETELNILTESADVLSANFKEYLKQRNILIDSADNDLIFHDPFNNHYESCQFMGLRDDHLSNSLLYCLNGNTPDVQWNNFETNFDEIKKRMSSLEKQEKHQSKFLLYNNNYLVTSRSLNNIHSPDELIHNVSNNSFVILKKRNYFDKIATKLFNDVVSLKKQTKLSIENSDVMNKENLPFHKNE